MKSSKPDTIWVELDEMFMTETLPENAITVKMIQDRYNISNNTALRKMQLCIANGWEHGRAKVGRYIVNYIIPPGGANGEQ